MARKPKVKVEKPSQEEIQFVISLFEKYNFDGSRVRAYHGNKVQVIDRVMRYLFVTGQVDFQWNWWWREVAEHHPEDFQWLINTWLEKGWGAMIPKPQIPFWAQRAFIFGYYGANTPAMLDWVPWGAASEKVVFKLKNK